MLEVLVEISEILVMLGVLEILEILVVLGVLPVRILEVLDILDILEILEMLVTADRNLRGLGKNARHRHPEHALGPTRKGSHSIWPWTTHGWAKK